MSALNTGDTEPSDPMNNTIKKRDKLRRLLSAIKLMEDGPECFTCCAVGSMLDDPIRVWYASVLSRHSGAIRGSVEAFWERDLNDVSTHDNRIAHRLMWLASTHDTRRAHRLMWLAFLHTLVSNNLE